MNNITSQVQVLSSPKEAIATYPTSQIYALHPEVSFVFGKISPFIIANSLFHKDNRYDKAREINEVDGS